MNNELKRSEVTYSGLIWGSVLAFTWRDKKTAWASIWNWNYQIL